MQLFAFLMFSWKPNGARMLCCCPIRMNNEWGTLKLFLFVFCILVIELHLMSEWMNGASFSEFKVKVLFGFKSETLIT